MRIRNIVAIFIALFALLTLFDRFVLVELLIRRTGLPLLLALGLAIAITGCGALLRRSKRIDFPIDFLIGYPILGAALYLVASIRISVWTLLPVAILAAAAAVFLFLKAYGNDEDLRAPRVPLPPLQWGAIACVAVLACGFVAAQAPPSSLDELAYHLAVPHTWVLEGRAIELPLLSHSYFPQGIESVDTIPLLLLGATGGGVTSHLLHLFAAIATTLLIARRSQSWLLTAAIVTTPALAITAGWSLVEWPLTGLFVVLWLALEDDDPHTASAATAAGLLVKYTFVPFAIAAWALKRRLPRWTAALGLLFFVRNLLIAGNPIAPFFSSIGTDIVTSYRELALADYIFEGAFIDEALGAAILTLPVFAAGLIPIAAALMALGLFFLAPSARILVPFLTVPAMSGAPQLKRRVIAVFVTIAIVVQTFLVIWFTARTHAFSLLAGNATEVEFLRVQRPSYAAIEWLNTILPKNARTLVVGVGETYWFATPVRGGGNFDGPLMSRYLDLPTPEALRARLQEDRITHVAIIAAPPATSVERKREERQTTLSPAAQRMLSQVLDRYAASVTTRGGAALFTLR